MRLTRPNQENLKKLKAIDDNLEILQKRKAQILSDLEQKKREMKNLIPEDLLSYPAENAEASPRDLLSKDSVKSFLKCKSHQRDKPEKKKKGTVQVTGEFKENLKHEEKILFDEIGKVYCDVLEIKNASLIKKMSPLQMMTKIDSYFESLVDLTADDVHEDAVQEQRGRVPE